jgi:hypothetical protein
MQRSLVLGLGATLFVPFVALPLWVAVHSRDLPDAGDADLAVSPPEVTAEDNGFDHLRRAAEAARISDDQHSEQREFALGGDSDPSSIEEAVAASSESLAELDRALAAPRFAYPPKPDGDPYADPGGVLSTVRKLAWLARADARRLLDSGSPAAARERALLAVRLGHRLADAPNAGLVEMLVAENVQRIGLGGLADVTRRGGRLDPADADRLLAELEATKIPAASWARTWAIEYQVEKAMVLRFRDSPDAFSSLGADSFHRPLHPYVSSFTYQPMRTAARFADRARELQREYAAYCTEAGRVRRRTDGHRVRLASAMLRGNVIGAWFDELDLPSPPVWNLRRCHVESLRALLQTAIVLRGSWDRERKLPHSLDELLPATLPAVPSDAFGGGPIHYDPEARMLHSIGFDFKYERWALGRGPDDELEPTVSVDFR